MNKKLSLVSSACAKQPPARMQPFKEKRFQQFVLWWLFGDRVGWNLCVWYMCWKGMILFHTFARETIQPGTYYIPLWKEISGWAKVLLEPMSGNEIVLCHPRNHRYRVNGRIEVKTWKSQNFLAYIFFLLFSFLRKWSEFLIWFLNYQNKINTIIKTSGKVVRLSLF